MKRNIIAAVVIVLFLLAASECKKLGHEPAYPDYSLTPDRFEPDGNSITAKIIVVNGMPQYHNSFTACDYDYVKFTAAAGMQYAVETLGLDPGSDTYMYLIERDGASVIITDDDGSDEPRASMIIWVCGVTGVYYVRVQQYNCLRIYGQGAGYKIRVMESMPGTPTTTPRVTDTLTPTITQTVTDTPFVTPTMTFTVTPMASAGTGLWHQVNDYSSRVPAGDPVAGVSAMLWWYGLDATGLYDTGAANTGEFFSGPFFVNTGDMLHFWSYQETENFAGYDTSRIYISDSMTGNWIQVADLYGIEHTWYRTYISLPPQFAGQNVYFRFVFDTVDSLHNDYPGWFVEDVSVGP